MRNNRNRNRNRSSPGMAIFLVILGLIMLSNASSILIGFLLMAIVAAVLSLNARNAQFDEAIRRYGGGRVSSYEMLDEDEEDDEEWQEAISAPIPTEERDPVYRHALQAVSAAGQDPTSVSVLVTDIGIMSARPAEAMSIYRTWTVPNDASYAHPFAQLRVPTKASGRLRFEILDSSGQVVYVDEGLYELKEGKNLITPPTRLPLEGQRALDGRWSLRISADGIPLALHRFEFQAPAQSKVRRHMGEDGEIHADLASPLADVGRKRVSLDELLADQQDDEKRNRL